MKSTTPTFAPPLPFSVLASSFGFCLILRSRCAELCVCAAGEEENDCQVAVAGAGMDAVSVVVRETVAGRQRADDCFLDW
jgi:hypothetical protein